MSRSFFLPKPRLFHYLSGAVACRMNAKINRPKRMVFTNYTFPRDFVSRSISATRGGKEIDRKSAPNSSKKVQAPRSANQDTRPSSAPRSQPKRLNQKVWLATWICRPLKSGVGVGVGEGWCYGVQLSCMSFMDFDTQLSVFTSLLIIDLKHFFYLKLMCSFSKMAICW